MLISITQTRVGSAPRPRPRREWCPPRWRVCEIPALIPAPPGWPIGSTRDAPAVDDSFLHFDVLDDARVLSMTPAGRVILGRRRGDDYRGPAAERLPPRRLRVISAQRGRRGSTPPRPPIRVRPPAIDPVRATSVVVRVSLNGEDTVPSLVGSEPLAFAYRPDPALAAVVADGGGATAFLDATDGLDALTTDLPGLSCVFGDVISSARTLGAVAGGGVSISCVAPSEGGGTGRLLPPLPSSPQRMPTQRPAASSLTSPSTPGSRSCSRYLRLVRTRAARCAPSRRACAEGSGRRALADGRFGGGPSALRVVSSAMATCEAPASSGEGSTTVGVAAHSGVSLAESETLPVFEFLADAFVSGVFPQTGSEFGGSSLVISGADFAPSERRSLPGTLAPVAARWISNERIETFAPAHDTATGGGVVPVEVSANNGGSNTWSQSGVALRTSPRLTSKGRRLRVSSRWRRRGDDRVWFASLGRRALVVPLRRRARGRARSEARPTPRSRAVRGASRRVVRDCLRGAAVPSRVHRPRRRRRRGTPRPRAARVLLRRPGRGSWVPRREPSDGGGLVFVMGANLRPATATSRRCARFGDGPLEGAPGVVVSSALMLCEAPERDVGIASLAASVSDGGVTYSYLAQGAGGASGVTHHFAPTARVTGSNPLAGPESGRHGDWRERR